MGGVPVLLALAVVGVDYGYQPDGQGKIDYIVQVSPEHWEQARDAGEITSVIDPSVRGRVNRIIIRIGDGELPRDSGPPAEMPADETDSSVSPSHALSPMPAPSGTVANIRVATADEDYVPTPDLLADAGQAAEALAARAMRPGPQSQEEAGGGFQLPGQQSGNDVNRTGAQRPNNPESQSEHSANAAERGGENATNGVQPPSTNPRSADPRSAANAQTAGPMRPGTQPRSAITERDDSDWTENPEATRVPSTPYRSDVDPTSGSQTADEGSSRAPASPSRGFGAQPRAPEPDSRDDDDAQRNRDMNNAHQGYASAADGYNRAPQANSVNGPPTTANGQAPAGNAYRGSDTPASLQGNRLGGYDEYGRPVNAAGQSVSSTSQSTRDEPVPERGYPSPSYHQSEAGRYVTGGSGTDRDRSRADAAGGTVEPTGVPRYGQDRLASRVPEPASPSDSEAARTAAEREIAAELAAERAALQANADDAAENPSVVSQPVFNFLLLVSLVANAYLILQMSRLLQRYRTMVANMRSASTPAA